MRVDNDPIANQAYSELVICCQAEGCVEDFSESLKQVATDPVEEWAEQMASKARSVGWTASDRGLVLCPIHSNN